MSALNAVIDSVSLAGVTPSSGGIASYGDVAPGTADCATTRTWPFTDPTDADFSFQGHAEGTVTVASCAQVLAANPAAPSGLQHRARRHVDQRVLRHDRSGRRVDRGPRPGRQRRVRLRKQGELGRAAQHRVAERRTVFDRELARCDPQRDELHFPQSVPSPQYLQYPLLNTYSTLSSIPTVPSPQYLQYPLLNTYSTLSSIPTSNGRRSRIRGPSTTRSRRSSEASSRVRPGRQAAVQAPPGAVSCRPNRPT